MSGLIYCLCCCKNFIINWFCIANALKKKAQNGALLDFVFPYKNCFRFPGLVMLHMQLLELY